MDSGNNSHGRHRICEINQPGNVQVERIAEEIEGCRRDLDECGQLAGNGGLERFDFSCEKDNQGRNGNENIPENDQNGNPHREHVGVANAGQNQNHIH